MVAMTTLLPSPESAVDQTRILKAFCALMSGENQDAALEVLAEAAREGKILAAVQTIAKG
jgi:hypothetical protein